MKFISKTDNSITLELSHEDACTLVELIRETCSGTPMWDFKIRIGKEPKEVGAIGLQLNQILAKEGIDL
ncbi:MAG: hypothetical protein PVF65_12400 [Sphingomonadales bacterium]|jgi:hypothetical protein